MILRFCSFLQSYIKQPSGATAIEYGLIVAGIALAIVGVVFTFGDGLESLFTALGPAMASATAEIETSR